MYNGIQITLIALKLTNHIDWSWFYVLLPLILKVIILMPLIVEKIILIIYILKKNNNNLKYQ